MESSSRFVREQLGPAIIGKSCPICLSPVHKPAVIAVCLHAYCADCIQRWSDVRRNCPLCKARFDSLFLGIDLPSRTFRTKRLSDLGTRFNGGSEYSNRGPSGFMTRRRAFRISREESNTVNRRTRPLPRRRSFGQSKLLPPGVIDERVLRWRASIYERNLRAVPCPSRSSLEQGFVGGNDRKERLLQRIEPWIRRELRAVLGDPDQTVLVHVVTSLFISSIEREQRAPSRRCGVEETNLGSLQPFLRERTIPFWHELRCFAESPFNMETYDTVVDYVKS